MSMQATVLTQIKIDVSPDGIRLTFDSLDSDLAKLMEQANTFAIEKVDHDTYDSSTVVIKTTKVIEFVEPSGT